MLAREEPRMHTDVHGLVHFGMRTDEKSNQIHLVNDAPRRPISKHTSKENPGTKWDDVKIWGKSVEK